MSGPPADALPSPPVEAPEPRPRRAAFISVVPLTPSELATLQRLSLEIREFDSGDAFLVSPKAYEHELYVMGGLAPMPETLRLLRLLNLRSKAPVLAWRTRAPCATWLDAGADMWLPRSASFDDLAAAIRALARRIPAPSALPTGPERQWRLQTGARVLHAPGGQQITLSETDSLVLECLADAEGAVVAYCDLAARLGHRLSDADNWLRATLYRLRRRIEQATGEAAPIDAQARKGYVFRGRLQKEV